MRLVGARDGFIRRPFLLEGFLTGFAGGVLAVILTGLAYLLVGRFLFEVEWLPGGWVFGGLAVGTVLGGLASMLAVRRHLREVT